MIEPRCNACGHRNHVIRYKRAWLCEVKCLGLIKALENKANINRKAVGDSSLTSVLSLATEVLKGNSYDYPLRNVPSDIFLAFQGKSLKEGLTFREKIILMMEEYIKE